MSLGDHDWLDSDAGPVVRPYAVTGGRAKPAVGGFDLVAFVVSRVDGSAEMHLLPEQRAILARTREPVSVAELASHLDLALGVVRVLLGDLVQQGLIEMHEPEYDQSVVGPQRPDDRILKAVVNGLRAL
jgi:predicted Rossmann fold nucleotide-binding protein DprA/Smf involved in DNA uptake